MTPSMIMWTLDLLDWVRGQMADRWPEVRLRGGETDIDPEPYRIRFRDGRQQYWLVLSPDAIRRTGISQVTSLLEGSDWISTLQKTGGVSVGIHDAPEASPVLLPWPFKGPEVKVAAAS
jgi:hypothetical protein